jgi:hypothetical protein
MDAFEDLRKRIAAPCWVEPGWQRIVVDAVERIEWLVAQDPVTVVEWRGIKEWHGSLAMRLRYLSGGDEIVQALISDVIESAKSKASRTCMVCAGAGHFAEDGEKLSVLCRQHEFAIDEHALDEAAVREMLRKKMNVYAVLAVRKRAWRVIGSVPSRRGDLRQMISTTWSERMEVGVEYVDIVERDAAALYRERDVPRHRLSQERVAQAVDDEIERLELNRTIVEVVKGARPRMWDVVMSDGTRTWQEAWIEDVREDDDVERVLDIAPVRIGKVRGEP